MIDTAHTIILMKLPGCKIVLASILCFWSIGCVEAPGQVTLDVRGVKPTIDYTDLAVVLEGSLGNDGALRPERFKPLSGRLDKQLKRLAVTGPNATPKLLASPQSRLAYWYNARAAWAIELARLEGFPEKVHLDRFMSRRFPLDGRTSTLAGIDRSITDEGGWRAVVAAPGLCLERARLPETPFGASDVRKRMQNRFSQFVDDPERFVIDISARKVRVPGVLWQLRRRIIDHHRGDYGDTDVKLTTVLLRYVTGSAHRRLQDAVGYVCVPAGCCPKLALFEKED